MSYSPFEEGDKIKCIDGRSSCSLRHDTIYVVDSPRDPGYVSVVGIEGGWFYDRFILIEKRSESYKTTELSDLGRLEKLEKQMERIIRDFYGGLRFHVGAGEKTMEEVLKLGDKPGVSDAKPKRRIEINGEE
jgi:hypothetical protein